MYGIKNGYNDFSGKNACIYMLRKDVGKLRKRLVKQYRSALTYLNYVT